jgi:cation-transporting P-type ATPase E
MRKLELYKRVLPSIGPIVFRNVFLLVNIVIIFVVVLLFVFGSAEAGLFLGIVFFVNTLLAIIQDVHARVLLEELQMKTALRVLRINKDKTETPILAEEIIKGDLLKLKLGDQAPCAGILTLAENLEVSEALITGESDSISKKEGDKVIAGAIITSGVGVIEAQGLFRESTLSVIAGDAKKYAASPSSIQQGTNTVIQYSGYILLATLLVVVVRGIFTHAPRLQIVSNAGALASTLVPQGLLVVITLLFAIGAADYSRRHILFQEINATEKLGRIKNLCVDKTGTLTDNILVVENMQVAQGISESDARSIIYACVLGLGTSSQTIVAVKKYLEIDDKKDVKQRDIGDTLPFSSWRRYGAVEVKKDGTPQSIFVGTSDIILPRITSAEEKKWLERVIEENAKSGRRLLCVASASGAGLPKDLSAADLSMMAIFVFRNTLRQGIGSAIKFFQDRGVRIRVLSGDNADTVRFVAQSVGVKGAENAVTGEQMEKWSGADFEKNAHAYTVFTQVLPEHKVKLVEAFKKDGFTAMVGDGVNDAQAMKKADLGIAMFDGAPVTRQLAGVILMTNSFTDLPGAVELADHFIRSIEITSGIYINQSLVGLFFFAIISIFGYSYPLMPLNITLINYLTVGFSGVLIGYWALRPSAKILRPDDKPFLKRVLPLVVALAVVEAIGTALVFAFSPSYLKIAPSDTLVGLSFIVFGYLFLLFAAKVYCGTLSKKEKLQLFLLGIFQLAVLFAVLQVPFLVRFFNITLPYPALIYVGRALLVILACGGVQYFIARKFFLNK